MGLKKSLLMINNQNFFYIFLNSFGKKKIGSFLYLDDSSIPLLQFWIIYNRYLSMFGTSKGIYEIHQRLLHSRIPYSMIFQKHPY
ncbi:hypothetical protein CH354_16990 [Leptospira levettii]|nr:hypothetical protein CH354_16990 [Leptospira levettii]PJZ89681.1 hypothetical protein CH368_05325 [Leptospira levettii]PJZ99437.1 hypothetical protein CH369_14685 [Leptospira levettii]